MEATPVLWQRSPSQVPLAAWLNYREDDLCWLLPEASGGYESCCSWTAGALGDEACWAAARLSFEDCCLERWTACDPVPPPWSTHGVDFTRHNWFFQLCGVAQFLTDQSRASGSEYARCLESRSMRERDCRRHLDGLDAALERVRSYLEASGERIVLSGVLEDGGIKLLLREVQRLRLRVSDLSGSPAPPDVLALVEVFQEHHAALFETAKRLRDRMLETLYPRTRPLRAEWQQAGGNMTTDADEVLDVTTAGCSASLAEAAKQSDDPGVAVPPPSIPLPLMEAFTMHGTAIVYGHSGIRQALEFEAGRHPAKEEAEVEWRWTQTAIDSLIDRARNGTLAPGPTSLPRVHALQRLLRKAVVPNMRRRWFVWTSGMESLLLQLGVESVDSIVPEPSRFQVPGETMHTRLRPVTLAEISHQAGSFDGGIALAVASAGTGRHGDKINPLADLQLAAAAWCLLKPSGILIAPPSPDAAGGQDILHWPSGRVYGKVRWPMLVGNFIVEAARAEGGVASVLRKQL
eukprot:TRINITY_DN34110_c0_g1_i1.p1 TRINITY_DN34110_c0_g1~~TRINITY_DN34110_c0_g1_i1.p1  ORF type:complete len:556 (+),score=69.96 TRINITY_DN34110_c0_g1_i1:113-1669(+)